MIRRKFRVFVVVLVVALVKTHIGGLAFQPAIEDNSTGAWFIELDSSAAAFRARAKESGITFTERFVFNRLWKGVSVQATRDAASMLGRLAGVKAVFPVVTMRVDPVEAA